MHVGERAAERQLIDHLASGETAAALEDCVIAVFFSVSLRRALRSSAVKRMTVAAAV